MEKVNAEWDKLIDMRNAAKDLIGAMPDPMHRAVLYARYINGQRWEDIAMDMHYSWKGIFKLHGQALRVFDQMHGDKLS